MRFLSTVGHMHKQNFNLINQPTIEQCIVPLFVPLSSTEVSKSPILTANKAPVTFAVHASIPTYTVIEIALLLHYRQRYQQEAESCQK